MIHYTCDCCKRRIDAADELRYIVRLEVYAALDPSEEADDDRDHLQEIQEVLERLDDPTDEDVCNEVYQQKRFDLCSDCRNSFVQDPLGRPISTQINFSQN